MSRLFQLFDDFVRQEKIMTFHYFFFATVFLATTFLAGAAALRIGFLAEVDFAPSFFSPLAYTAGVAFFSAFSSAFVSLPENIFKKFGSAMVLLLLMGYVRIVHMVFMCVKLFY